MEGRYLARNLNGIYLREGISLLKLIEIDVVQENDGDNIQYSASSESFDPMIKGAGIDGDDAKQYYLSRLCEQFHDFRKLDDSVVITGKDLMLKKQLEEHFF